MSGVQAAVSIGAAILFSVAVIALAMWLGRPQQPVADPVEQRRRDLAAKVQPEADRERDRRDRADDDVNDQGDDH
ncbi:hypothetical protein [Sphaerisporangium sp. TRM90804]|uniref:hypothetical protein n=1 Tax=Sphaerisporangium sp. TRM90804 TaxID=3031113 RepID=UPI00244CF795|nr:hypothetical protein [Sphaerisporangium sp. TRM90804]MDH2424847.1 hypothetical protein [Sphaerisporangium sp. TRM90804]